MFCQNCWATESPWLPLVDMRKQVFKLKHHEIDALTFFEHRRQVKIEDAVKICHSCIYVLGREVYQQLMNTMALPNIMARVRDGSVKAEPNVQIFDLIDMNQPPATKTGFETKTETPPELPTTHLMTSPEQSSSSSSSHRSTPARSRSSSVKNETPDQRARRLEENRLRMKMKRATETPEQRARRLETGKLRMKIRRATETPDQRAQRLEEGKLRMQIKRASETPEERAYRMEQLKYARTVESPDQRARRLEENKQHMSMRRAMETPDQRARRLENGKMRMKIRRENAAHSDPAENPFICSNLKLVLGDSVRDLSHPT